MSDTLAQLRHKIESGKKIKSIVRTMKILASTYIKEYEMAHLASLNYYMTVKKGLIACCRQEYMHPIFSSEAQEKTKKIQCVVFGSDQGLVGQFNEDIVRFTESKLQDFSGEKQLIIVGLRLESLFEERSLHVDAMFSMPNIVSSLTSLIVDILLHIERSITNDSEVYLLYNRHTGHAQYEPSIIRLIPLDRSWKSELEHASWSTKQVPQVIEDIDRMTLFLLREYLFVSLARTCTESLVSENRSRLVAMQRAETKIQQLVKDLGRAFHLARQNTIDSELFDVISGYSHLSLR